jgi:crotonobetainyl-CoA:carnitine CoA-transferase CaiB-like acyl-CoA transferase
MIGGRDHNRADYENLHRNKESLTLNMKEPEGVAILHELVKKADVFIENYRPDVKHRLGIGPDELRAINPRLVYASISGFGQDGPYANWPGFDSIAQGMGGLMSVTGKPEDGPMRVGIPLADLCAGHFCAMGILTALLEREVSGEGQWVKTSLLESQIAMLDFQAAQWLIDKKVPGQHGNEHPLTVPTGVFQTKDGYLNIAAIGQNMWTRLCEALELKHLLSEAGLGSGPRTCRQPRPRERRCRRCLQAAHDRRMDRAPAEGRRALRPHPHDRQGVRRPAGRAPGHPLADETPAARRHLARRPADEPVALPARGEAKPAPQQGDDTGAILQELGYSQQRIAELRAAFVV